MSNGNCYKKFLACLNFNSVTTLLDDIVNKYNNIYHRTIKMKHVGVKSITYIDCSKEISNKNRKFEIGY